jgi:hypothetical protein
MSLDEHEKRGVEAPDTEPADRTRKVTRRRALQVIAASAAGAAALPAAACAPGDSAGTNEDAGPADAPSQGGNPRAAGTPTDPDLISPVVPWDLVLTDDELDTLAALCDVILPADERSPGAAELGAHEFIDEWVSAPYEGNERDLVLIRGGVTWLERESASRFGARFAALTTEQHTRICDGICYLPNAAPELRAAARFFDRVRDLTATAFWTTDEGMSDLGFVGNTPMGAFEGPPPEVLDRLGLA